MLLDDNLVMIDSAALVSAITPTAVGLKSFLHPGKMDAVPVYICADKTTSGNASAAITINFQQASAQIGNSSGASSSGVWVNAGPSWTLTASQLASGVPVGPRYLPREVTQPWIRLNVSKTGTFSAGALTAAIVREDYQPYEADEKIEA